MRLPPLVLPLMLAAAWTLAAISHETPDSGGRVLACGCGGCPLPPVPPISCLADGREVVIHSASRQVYADSGIGIDATGITMLGPSSGPYSSGQVQISGSDVCWHGGKVRGQWNQDTTSWDTYHSTTGFYHFAPASIYEALHVENFGDAIRFRDYFNPLTTVRHSRFTDMHDDVWENDDDGSLLAHDNLVDRAYVIVSTRGNDASNGATTVELRDNLLRLHSFANNYQGSVGYQGVFKMEKDGSEPRLKAIRNTIFAVGSKHSRGITLAPYVNKTDACIGNRLWLYATVSEADDALAKGDGPDGMGSDAERIAALNAAFPGCIEVQQATPGTSEGDAMLSAWHSLRSAWISAHPEVLP